MKMLSGRENPYDASGHTTKPLPATLTLVTTTQDSGHFGTCSPTFPASTVHSIKYNEWQV
jgi:hypothetical protein